MKIVTMFTAAIVAVTGIAAAAPAAAGDRIVVRERTLVRHDDRRGWNNRSRTVCRTQWRHGHRERICRRARGRY